MPVLDFTPKIALFPLRLAVVIGCACVMSSCGPTEDPVVGIWKVEKPVLIYTWDNDDGSPNVSMYHEFNQPIVPSGLGAYALVFNADHAFLIKKEVFMGASMDIISGRWDRVGKDNIMLDLGVIGGSRVCEVHMDGSHLLVSHLQVQGREETVVCDPVDSLPEAPPLPNGPQ